jgi:hypothetical protein
VAATSVSRISNELPDEASWKLEGLFHVCASWLQVEDEFDLEDGQVFAAKEVIRQDLDVLLRGSWMGRPDLKTPTILWSTLINVFTSGFGSATGVQKEMTDRFFVLLAAAPTLALPAQMERFNSWGHQAAGAFWTRLRDRRGLRFPPRPKIIIEADGTSPMTFESGPTRSTTGTIRLHVPFTRMKVVDPRELTWLNWYLAIPFFFMHEYVSHVFPIDLDNRQFQDGWLFSLAGRVLENGIIASPPTIDMPKRHATVYHRQKMIRTVDVDVFDAAKMAEEFFDCLIREEGNINVLIDFSCDLALIPKGGTATESIRADRAIGLMYHWHGSSPGKDAFFNAPHHCVQKIWILSR